jgi:hypothetical protein
MISSKVVFRRSGGVSSRGRSRDPGSWKHSTHKGYNTISKNNVIDFKKPEAFIYISLVIPYLRKMKGTAEWIS